MFQENIANFGYLFLGFLGFLEEKYMLYEHLVHEKWTQ